MPSYAQFADQKVDFAVTANKVGAMKAVGVPYTDAEVSSASADAKAQGEKIADNLKGDGITVTPDSEMVAIIAYLQRVGKTPTRPGSGGAITLAPNQDLQPQPRP
jgi:cytochrome c oxidase cbb3-type subunit I/II